MQKKYLGPPNIGPSPPRPPIPISQLFSQALLQFQALCTPNKTKSWPISFKYSSPNTDPTFSLSQKTHPLTHEIPYSLYLLFFCFVFFDTLPLALVPLPTSPQNSSPLSSQSQKKKIPDQFFLSSLALVLELGDYLVSFLLFLKHQTFISF